jgi:hypothetical protein
VLCRRPGRQHWYGLEPHPDRRATSTPASASTSTAGHNPTHGVCAVVQCQPILVGGNSTVIAFAWDDGCGIDSGTVSVGDRPPEPMAWSGSASRLTWGRVSPQASIRFSVRVRDAAGNEATTDPQTLVVYDPTAASVSGTGWIVPDPNAGDDLPGIDGKAKGSFSFVARYKRPSDTTPTGSFIFSYGKLFKLQSEGLEWLVVTAGDAAYIQGTASIRGEGVVSLPGHHSRWRADRLP